MGLNMDDSNSNVIELIGKVLVVTVLMLLFVVIFLFVLYICNKASMNASTASATATLFQFVAHGGGYEDLDLAPLRRRGLDPSVLKSIPMVSAEEMKEKLECAVCLCDISEGEKARLLPKCNHGFHVECIDMWFQSNSTCPVCRNPVVSDLSNLSSAGLESTTSIDVETTINQESSNLPTNSLFLGNDDTRLQVRSEFPHSSTSTSNNEYGGMMVIDIPLQINEAAAEEEGEAYPPPPAPPTRLRSFKRLLIRDHTRVSPSCPRDFDGQRERRS